MAVYEGYQYQRQGKTITMTQLTAPAAETDTVKVLGIRNFLWQYTIATINTSVDVIAWGSLDNSNWFNLDVDTAVTQQTANGTYALCYQGEGEIGYTKFEFEAEVGGTDATIDVVFKPGGKEF